MIFKPLDYIKQEGFKSYMNLFEFDKKYKFFGSVVINEKGWQYDYFDTEIKSIGFNFIDYQTNIETKEGREIILSLSENLEIYTL